MYAATVNGQRLTFEVLGVWRRNLIMQDRETGTVWQQATGEALYGPLKGAQLELLGGEQTTWHDWLTRYPETAVSIEPLNPPQGLLSFGTLEYLLEKFTGNYKTPGLNRNDTRLPSHEEVGGVIINHDCRAYPISKIRGGEMIQDMVGGVPLVVCYDSDNDKLHAYRQRKDGRPDPNQPLAIQRQYWLGWSEFHPTTTIFGIDQ